MTKLIVALRNFAKATKIVLRIYGIDLSRNMLMSFNIVRNVYDSHETGVSICLCVQLNTEECIRYFDCVVYAEARMLSWPHSRLKRTFFLIALILTQCRKLILLSACPSD